MFQRRAEVGGDGRGDGAPMVPGEQSVLLKPFTPSTLGGGETRSESLTGNVLEINDEFSRDACQPTRRQLFPRDARDIAAKCYHFDGI